MHHYYIPRSPNLIAGKRHEPLAQAGELTLVLTDMQEESESQSLNAG